MSQLMGLYFGRGMCPCPDWYRPMTAMTVSMNRKAGMTATSIVAQAYPFVVGIDTHARNHVYAILTANTGALLETRQFPTPAAGINRAIDWDARRAEGNVDTLWVIEGAASYGATLTGTVATHGFSVAEAPRMDVRKRRGVGRSNAVDSCQIAMSSLPLPVDKLHRPACMTASVRACGSWSPPAHPWPRTAPGRSTRSTPWCAETTWASTLAKSSPAPRSPRSHGGGRGRRNSPCSSLVPRRCDWPNTSWSCLSS